MTTMMQQIEDMKKHIELLIQVYSVPSIQREYLVVQGKGVYCGGEEKYLQRLQRIHKKLVQFAMDDPTILSTTVGTLSPVPMVTPAGTPPKTPTPPEHKDELFDLEVPIFNNCGELTDEKPIKFTNLTRRRYNLLSYCHKQCRVLSRFPLRVNKIDGRAPLVILTNDCQGWKTLTYMYYMVIAVEYGYNIIVITQNDTDQYTQFEDSLSELYENLISEGMKYDFTPPLMVPIYVGNAGENMDKAEDALLGGGAIIASIDNIHQLSRISDIMDKWGLSINDHIVIHDESDDTVKRTPSRLSQRDVQRLRLFQTAEVVVGVTATPQAHFIGEGQLTTRSHLIKASLPEDYVGCGHNLLTLFPVCQRVEDFSVMEVYDNEVFVPPSWFTAAVEHFMTLPPRSTGEPHDLLVKISNLVQNHKAIQDWFIQNYPNVSTMINNGTEMELYVPWYEGSLRHWTFQGYIRRGNLHTWKRAPYSHLKSRMLDLYEEYGDSSNPFVEIAGLRSGRGLRHKTKDHKWMLSALLYMDCNDKDYAAVIQAVGRIFGKRGEDMDTKYIYSSQVLFNTMVLGYSTYQKHIFSSMPGMMSMTDVLKAVPLSREEAETKLTKEFSIRAQKRRVAIDDLPRGLEIPTEDNIFNYVVKILSNPKDTKIKKFLFTINIHNKYRDSDLLELLEKAGYKQPNNIIDSFTTKEGPNIYGSKFRLFNKEHNLWIPRSCLINAIKKK